MSRNKDQASNCMFSHWLPDHRVTKQMEKLVLKMLSKIYFIYFIYVLSSQKCKQIRKEKLDEAARNFLHATKQPPPTNFSNLQQKSQVPSNSSLPQNNNNVKPLLNPSSGIPNVHQSLRGNNSQISTSVPKQNGHPGRTENPNPGRTHFCVEGGEPASKQNFVPVVRQGTRTPLAGKLTST